jgi:hypothetical protein
MLTYQLINFDINHVNPFLEVCFNRYNYIRICILGELRIVCYNRKFILTEFTMTSLF